MCLKNKIIAAIMCALIAGIGVASLKTNTADAQSTNANVQISSTLSIEQLQQILVSLQQQIQQVMQLIAQKKNQPTCGNGKCDANETAVSCAQDCAKSSIPVSSGSKVLIYEQTGAVNQYPFNVADIIKSPKTFLTTARETYTVSSDGTNLTIHCSHPGSGAGLSVGDNVVAVRLDGVSGYPSGVWASSIVKYTLGYNGIADSRFNILGSDTAVGPYMGANNNYLCTFLGDQDSEITVGFSGSAGAQCGNGICETGEADVIASGDVPSHKGTCPQDCGNPPQTCANICRTQGYINSQCNTYAISPQGFANQCAAGYVNSNTSASDCAVSNGIVGIGKACCCSPAKCVAIGQPCQTNTTANTCCAGSSCQQNTTTKSWSCQSITPVCGNGICETGENINSCPKDCPFQNTTCNQLCQNNNYDSGYCDIRTVAPGTSSLLCNGTNLFSVGWTQDCYGGAQDYSAKTCCCKIKASTAVCGNGKCEDGEDANSCPQDCKTSACLSAGYELGSGQSCCSGLLPLVQKHSIYTDNWTCLPLSTSRTVCANCGNGICGPGESFCDCPQDCCTPGTTSGCKYCGTSEMWTDDSTKCASGQTCTGGICTGHCTNACSSGSKQCSAIINGYQNCFNNNYGCTEWSAPTACPAGQTCANGTCTSPNANATLTISLDANSPKSRNIIANSSFQILGATLLTFDMQASGSNLSVNAVNANFTVTAANTASTAYAAPKTAYLYNDNGVVIGTASPNGSGAVSFNNLNYAIPKDTIKSFTIRFDAAIPQPSDSTHISNNDGQKYVVSVPSGGVSFMDSNQARGTNTGTATSYAASVYAEGPIFTLSSINTSSIQPSSLSSTFNIQAQAVSGDVYIPSTGAFTADYGKDGTDTGIVSNVVYNQPTGSSASGNYYKVGRNTSVTFIVNATFVSNGTTGATYDLRIKGITWNHTGSVIQNILSNYMANDPMWNSQAVYLQGAVSQPVCGKSYGAAYTDAQKTECSGAGGTILCMATNCISPTTSSASTNCSGTTSCYCQCGQVVGGNCNYKTFAGNCTITGITPNSDGPTTVNYSFVPSGTVDVSGTYLTSSSTINPYNGSTVASGFSVNSMVGCTLSVITSGTCTPITVSLSTATNTSPGASGQLPFGIDSISASLSQLMAQLAALLGR